MTRVTIEQVADLAQVSRSTVSRVLNDHPNVSRTVRERVLRVIDETGYTPEAAARSLASRRADAIGVLIPRSTGFIFTDPFFHHVIQGITDASTRRGYFLMLATVTSEMERGFYNRILRSRHFDGVIMLSSDIDDPILPLLIRDRTPLVMIGHHPYLQKVDWVDVDNREGARQAVEHLIGLGHRCIATITGPLQMVAALDRRDGYKQALLEAGLPIQADLIVEGDFTQEGGFVAMKRLLSGSPHPTAVFVASDSMAVGALRAAHEAGFSVPRDLALVGFDDLPIASYSNPPLTTVHQPIYEIGATAAELLLDRLEGKCGGTSQVCLETRLVIRDSSGRGEPRRLSAAG